MIPTDRLERFTVDIVNGVEPITESEEEANMVVRLKKEIKNIQDEGGIIDIPPEIP